MTAAAHQDELLRAALLRGTEATDAWCAWSSATDVDSLDGDSQWLLPLLAVNLADQGVRPDRIARYTNVYRHHWYRNLLALRRFEATLDEPGADRSAVYGGAAIALERRDALGVRPIETIRTVGPSAPLLGAPFDRELVERSQRVEWHGRHWPVLDPADHLVVICISRDTWSSRSSLLWIIDAATLLLRHPSLDRVRVEALARRLDRAEDVAHALQEIERRSGLPTSLVGDWNVR